MADDEADSGRGDSCKRVNEEPQDAGPESNVSLVKREVDGAQRGDLWRLDVYTKRYAELCARVLQRLLRDRVLLRS